MFPPVIPSDARFTQRYGPEWGSGGIFGLKYHRKVLYFTLAFEAEAHFHRADEERVYRFNLVGPLPTSGGDTYNAVAAVDDFIYFGGWVHAPAVYLPSKRRISFVNKYSHVHVYDLSENEVSLLWKESIHDERKWSGEVSDIIYDPYGDRLLLAREDGHENLGIYSLDRRNGRIRRLLDRPSLKGTLVHDMAFFGVGKNFSSGLEGLACLDLVDGRWEFYSTGKSIDNKPIRFPQLGSVASFSNEVFAFVRGGMFTGNSADGEFRFVRLFDFPSMYGPMRSNSLNFAGGVLTAFSALHDSYRDMLPGPSVLLYVSPGSARIVGAFGTRITSLEKIPGGLIVATNTAPNAGETEATPFDTGVRDITFLPDDIIQRRPPALRFSLPACAEGGVFGGIPLSGYIKPRMIINMSGKNRLRVYEYDLEALFGVESYELQKGRNLIDLSSFSGIVSFELERCDRNGRIAIELA